jgi:hypothetical protein
MVENERWKDIKGYEGIYDVSTFGNVRNIKKNKLLKPEETKKGRLLVKLSKEGKTKKYQVHRLVAETFIDNPYFYDTVNHIDENPKNNNVNNLEWCTAWNNTCYSMEKHLICENEITHKRTFYNSVNSTVYDGFNKGHVAACCRGEEKHHKNCIFKYVTDELYILGIDESYNRTGICLMCDKIPIEFISVDFKNCYNNSDKRKEMRKTIHRIVREYRLDKRNTKCIVERIRLFSQGHLSENYIMSTAGLLASINDVLSQYNIKMYSVNTNSWKTQIVGTTKAQENSYGINPNKYLTIQYLKTKGLLKKIVIPYKGRGTKGVVNVKINGVKTRCKINDDIADAYCIACYGFIHPSMQKLKEENF